MTRLAPPLLIFLLWATLGLGSAATPAGDPEATVSSYKDLRKIEKGIIFINDTGSDYKLQLLPPTGDAKKQPGTVEVYAYDPDKVAISNKVLLGEKGPVTLASRKSLLLAPVPKKSWLLGARPAFDRLFTLAAGPVLWKFKVHRDAGTPGSIKEPAVIWFNKKGAEVSPPFHIEQKATGDGTVIVEIQ